MKYNEAKKTVWKTKDVFNIIYKALKTVFKFDSISEFNFCCFCYNLILFSES